MKINKFSRVREKLLHKHLILFDIWKSERERLKDRWENICKKNYLWDVEKCWDALPWKNIYVEATRFNDGCVGGSRRVYTFWITFCGVCCFALCFINSQFGKFTLTQSENFKWISWKSATTKFHDIFSIANLT